MFCINCGKQNPDNANFCYFCGTALEKDIPSPVEPVMLDAEPTTETEEPIEMNSTTGNAVPSPQQDGKRAMAITGLVFSVVGLAISVLCCVFFGSMIIGIACSAIGIVLCAISVKGHDAATIAITGLIIGIIGVIIGVIMLVFFLAILATDAISFSFFEDIIEEFIY